MGLRAGLFAALTDSRDVATALSAGHPRCAHARAARLSARRRRGMGGTRRGRTRRFPPRACGRGAWLGQKLPRPRRSTSVRGQASADGSPPVAPRQGGRQLHRRQSRRVRRGAAVVRPLRGPRAPQALRCALGGRANKGRARAQGPRAPNRLRRLRRDIIEGRRVVRRGRRCQAPRQVRRGQARATKAVLHGFPGGRGSPRRGLGVVPRDQHPRHTSRRRTHARPGDRHRRLGRRHHRRTARASVLDRRQGAQDVGNKGRRLGEKSVRGARRSF